MEKLFLVLIIAGFIFEVAQSSSIYREVNQVPSKERVDVEWDHFMLVTEWPQSSCEEVNATHQHDCVIPRQVNGWVLHGLWPSTYNGTDPQYCKHWSFTWEAIQDLDVELVANWPNLYADTSKTSFWKHEYEKHGTCAASVKGFESEHDFFHTTLMLKEKYSPSKVLNQHDITPSSETSYNVSMIKNAFKSSFNAHVCIECGKVKGIGELLMGMYVCLDKSLSLVDCYQCEHECKDDTQVMYHPLSY